MIEVWEILKIFHVCKKLGGWYRCDLGKHGKITKYLADKKKKLNSTQIFVIGTHVTHKTEYDKTKVLNKIHKYQKRMKGQIINRSKKEPFYNK